MIDVELRLVVAMILTAIVTAAGPVAIGGAIGVAGAIAAILAARTVVRGDETSVTVSIVFGGLVAAATLSHGPVQALVVVAGVFVGAELAAFGRRLAIDPESPAGAEMSITLATVGVGLAAGAVVAVVSLWHATPPVANLALVVLLAVGAVAFVLRFLRRPAE